MSKYNYTNSWNKPKKHRRRGVMSGLVRGYREAPYSARKTIFYLCVIGIVLFLLCLVLGIMLLIKTGQLKKSTKESDRAKLEKMQAESELEIAKKALSEKEPDITKVPDVTPSVTKAPETEDVKDRYVVCLDAGHGGKDDGALLIEGSNILRYERDDNLEFCKALKESLEKLGVRVVMTREENTFVELSDRTYLANTAKSDLLVSIHRNSYYSDVDPESNQVSGVEVWLHNSKPDDMTALAGEILSVLENIGISRNRGVKYGTMEDSSTNYAINRNSNMGSMIIEFGFITNEADNANLDSHKSEYADGIAKTIYGWLCENVSLEKK